MKAVRPAVQGCIAIHFPSMYGQSFVKVAFVPNFDLNQLHAKGKMKGAQFKELITKMAACTDVYQNIGFHEPLSVQIRVVPSSEWCYVT